MLGDFLVTSLRQPRASNPGHGPGIYRAQLAIRSASFLCGKLECIHPPPSLCGPCSRLHEFRVANRNSGTEVEDCSGSYRCYFR